MRARYSVLIITMLLTGAILSRGQGTIVVNDPTKTAAGTKISKSEEKIFNRDALPKVRKQLTNEVCNESVEVAGVAHGAFSKIGAQQTLVFYQYCQTGNGLGQVGLVLIENAKVIGNYVSDGGWSVDIATVSDINQNGLDEFILSFSGGLHQGQGGIGVDLMEFSGNAPKGIGWYRAEEILDTESTSVWKLTAKPGRVPVFYRQKYAATGNNKWKVVGRSTKYTLGKAYSKFTEVK